MEGASLIKKPRPSEAEAFDPCDVCCCCFSSAPHAQDAHAEGVRLFRAPLFSACFDDAICCLATCICLPCSLFQLRLKVLEEDVRKYRCCQGYYDKFWKCLCLANGCGESNCPHCCLCLEALYCHSCSISSTRLYLMDAQYLRSDPCDRRILRFNNCMQILTCTCLCAACCSSDVTKACAERMCVITELIFLFIAACMAAQVNVELNYIFEHGGHVILDGGPQKQSIA